MNPLRKTIYYCCRLAAFTTLFFVGNALAEERDPYQLPEYGMTRIAFEACTADGYTASLIVNISNFSPYDMTLPANRCLDSNHQEQPAESETCKCEYGEKTTKGNKTYCPFYQWATKEENAAAAATYMQINLSKQVKKDSAEAASTLGYLSEIITREDVISGTLEDGRSGDWPVSVSLKTMLQTKMELMSKGKYSSMSIDLRPENSFVSVNREKTCSPE